MKEYGTPLFVYEESVIEKNARTLLEAGKDFHISYAMKANENSQILRLLRSLGITSVDVVSPG